MLLLVTNRKSYTGFRLAPNTMTLNNLKRQNRGFINYFLAILGCNQVYIIHKVAPRYYRYAIQIENLAFVY